MLEDPRLACLARLNLETIPDAAIFSRIAELTAETLNCPISLVSIVEDRRQWFLGSKGTDFIETPIDLSFCAMCIGDEAPMLVRDARNDPRFCDNSLVVGAPFIRSYLGVPIRYESGEALGTLCAISPQVDAFSDDQVKPLKLLAELVEQNIILHARTRELRRSHAALSEAEKVFSHAEQAANIGSWRVDIRTNALHWSRQAHKIHGLEAAYGPVAVEDAVAFYPEEERGLVAARLRAAIEHGTPMQFETQISRKDGSSRRIRVIDERIDRDGKPRSVAGIVQDCTDEYLSTLALKRAAERDRLTGLYNRAEFDRRLNAAVQRADVDDVTVAIIDLDGFKEINDTLGHLAGDRVLADLAVRFQNLIGPDIFLARWGGDEFALLFPANTCLDEAKRAATELIEETHRFSQQSQSPQLELLGATCGIAQLDALLPGEEIVRRADLALYKGKQENPGSVVCWDQTLDARQSNRKAAVMRLRHALDNETAFAAYQPILDLRTHRIVSFEALLRLPDGRGGMVSAGEVFSALLDPVLSRRVSQMMLKQVVRDGPHLLDIFGTDCRIGINLSEADLRESSFAGDALAMLSDGPLQPGNLTIEVTETMLLSDENGGLRSSLQLFHQAGCTIALDDFGTGFSSLSNLRRFPIRKLKIDREFISSIASDDQSRLIIQAVVEMSRGLGLGVVAEGVENEDQEEFLKQIGCYHVQGYRYSYPQPVGHWITTAGKSQLGRLRA